MRKTFEVANFRASPCTHDTEALGKFDIFWHDKLIASIDVPPDQMYDWRISWEDGSPDIRLSCFDFDSVTSVLCFLNGMKYHFEL